MPTQKREAKFDDELELASYLSSYRDLVEKIKEKYLSNEKIELNQTQEIEAQQNKQSIQKANGTSLISKIVNGLLFILLQLEISIKEMRKYIKQYEINEEIMSKKIKEEIEEIINIQNRMLESSLKEYYEMQKRKEEIRKEMEQLMIKISIINKRLDEIWKEQHLIVANMITNLDKVVEISLEINNEQKTISFSMREVRDEIQKNAFSERKSYLSNTPELIIFNSMMEVINNQFFTLYNIAPEFVSTKTQSICNNLSIEVIQGDPNKIVNLNNFHALENEKNHHIEDKKILDSRLNNLEDENLHIISSMNCLELTLEKESQKVYTIFQHVESSIEDYKIKNFMPANEEKYKGNLDNKDESLLKTNVEIDERLKPLEIKHDIAKVVPSDIPSSTIENTLSNVMDKKDNKELTHNSETKTRAPRKKRINLLDDIVIEQENTGEKAQENKEAKSPGLLVATGLFTSRHANDATIDKSQITHNKDKASNDKNAATDKDAPAEHETPRRSF